MSSFVLWMLYDCIYYGLYMDCKIFRDLCHRICKIEWVTYIYLTYMQTLELNQNSSSNVREHSSNRSFNQSPNLIFHPMINQFVNSSIMSPSRLIARTSKSSCTLSARTSQSSTSLRAPNIPSVRVAVAKAASSSAAQSSSSEGIPTAAAAVVGVAVAKADHHQQRRSHNSMENSSLLQEQVELQQ